MNEVTQIEAPENTLPADPMMAMIERVMLAPDLPVERINAVMDVRERQMQKEAEIEFNQSFSEMMGEMPVIPRNGKSNRNTYSTIDDIVQTTRPVLSKFGMALNWEVVTDLEKRIVTVTAVVRHKLGHTIRTTHQGGFDKSGDNDNQKARSTETYLKRYSATSILGLATGEEFEDDGATNGTPTVTVDQFIQLRDKIEEAGVKEDLILTAYDALSIQEFPAGRFDSAMKKLQATINKKAAS